MLLPATPFINILTLNHFIPESNLHKTQSYGNYVNYVVNFFTTKTEVYLALFLASRI